MNSLRRLRHLLLPTALLLIVAPSHAAEPGPAAATPAKSALEQRVAQLILPKLEFREATLKEGVAFLRAKARALDPDHLDLPLEISPAAEANDAKITIALQNISFAEALHYVAAKARLNIRYGTMAVSFEPGPAGEWRRLKMPPSPESRSLEERARAIIIPRVEFRGASVNESLDFIKQKGQYADPSQRGINVVQLDVPQAQLQAARVTFKLDNVSLYDALRAVGETVDAELVAEPEALVLRMKSTAK